MILIQATDSACIPPERPLLWLFNFMNDVDKRWIDGLRHFMGDGSLHQPVPFYTLADGTVDAFKTLTAAFGLYDIHPKTQDPKNENS